MEKIVYYSSGMKHFGEQMVRYMGFRLYNPQTDIDKEVFFQSLYFDPDYEIFKNHKGKRILYWNGSDILRTLMSPKWLKIIKDCPAKYLCHSPWQKEVLRRIGLDVKIHPLFFGDINNYPISYKQSDKPHIYMTSHTGRDKEYGVDIIERVASSLPEFTFHIYGSEAKTKNKNVIYHGWVHEDVMDKDIRNYHGCFKGGSDGIAITLMKCILMGQYPISLQKIEGVRHAPDDKTLIKMLKNIKEKEKPNYNLRKQYLNHFKIYEDFSSDDS